MKKPVLLLLLVTTFSFLYAQTMTVAQMESKWRTLYYKGVAAFNNQDYAKAEQCFVASIDHLKANEAANTKYHIYSLIKLGENYNSAGKKQDLASVTNELVAIKLSIRPGSKRYIDYLYNIGIFYSDLGQYQEAETCFHEALSFIETLGQMSGMKPQLLHRQALCQFSMGKTEKAIENEQLGIEADDNQTPDYYQSLAFFYYKLADWNDLDKLMPQCFDCSREPILRQFSLSNAKDRAAYWSRAGLFFTDFLPEYAVANPSPTMLSYAYDAALFSKGVLLAAENKSTEITLNSNNPGLLKLYDHYLELKDKKDRSIDEEFEMQSISDVLLRHQKEHKNEYRQDFRIRWMDIKEKLGKRDVAIEFFTVPNEVGIVEYYALSVRRDSEYPKLTKLASFDRLSSVPVDSIYRSSEMYDMIWRPLESEMRDVENVYFAPAGMFYNTGIEYLSNHGKKAFNTLKKVYRLSSTKEIVLRKNLPVEKCALFGGINYDTDVSTMAGQLQEFDTTVSIKNQIPLDSLELRSANSMGGFAFLNGSMEEVGEISMVALDADIPADLYSGDEGSETVLKNLSGTKVSVLHIATHGFYYANKRMGTTSTIDQLFNKLSFNFTIDNSEAFDEDKMMTRSGLVMAGANNLLRKVSLPKGIEDGILHADEIANLNLNRTGLVVLSACQSGLGDIVSSEGVFGLQRGFKKAGAKSIIMSLWRVNDEATRILMTELYRNLMSGQSKREALTNAQMALRSYDGGVFDKPEYWAAFVLLDAID